MTTIDTKIFKEKWFSFEEVESVKRWLSQVESWEVYDENTFYSNLEKRIFKITYKIN